MKKLLMAVCVIMALAYATNVMAQDPNYTVKPGDTLGKIAAAHGTSWKALYNANRGVIANPHVLKVGATLHV